MEYKLRVSVVGLFVDHNEVLLIDQATPPEPDRWDLPGGGLEPSETLMDGLRREVQEETGITDFQVERLLTVVERFYPRKNGSTLHTINLIYQCVVSPKLTSFASTDPEIGARGIQWVTISELTPELCSTRTWKALVAANLVL